MMAHQDTIKLYQFPISHYCEKVRWALDYKGLAYQKINCLPGLHSRTTKKLAKNSSVPVLTHRSSVVQGSLDILDYLEQQFPETPLSSAELTLANDIKHWEQFADKHIGPHVRRIMYHQLLNYPDIVIPVFSQEGPWYSPVYFKLTYPKLSHIMRKLMHINDESVEASRLALNQAIDKIEAHIASSASSKNTYLVGDHFSRADLTVAAMLAPLFLPKAYGVNWPPQLPDSVEAIISEYQARPALTFAKALYQKHR